MNLSSFLYIVLGNDNQFVFNHKLKPCWDFYIFINKKRTETAPRDKKDKRLRLEKKKNGRIFSIITSTTKRKDVIKLHEPNKLI